MNRNAILAISVTTAAVFYGVLLVAAPRITLLKAGASAPTLDEIFQVHLAEHVPEPYVEERTPPAELASRPGSVADLLQDQDEPAVPTDSLMQRQVEIPGLAERAAVEPLTRDYELSPEAQVLEKLDAKIIEISENDARKNIEVARRLVAPSPSRIVEEGEYPTLRAVVDPLEQEVLSFGQRGISGPPDLAGLIGTAGVREGDSGIEAAKQDLPDLPEEALLARAPAVDEARAENPHEFLDDLVDIELDTYVPPDQPQGFFRLRIIPKQGKDIEVLPKDVTYVIDASSSIVQRKLDLTARGVADAIQMLRPEDRFNVVVFRDNAVSFRAAPVPASGEEKAAALAFLQGLQARGQTNVYESILPVIETPRRPGYPGMMVVVTDGRPTTGVKDSRTIINDLTAENRQRNTIVAFGGGKTVNVPLLDLLAYRNRGESYIAPQIEGIGQELPQFLKKMNDPILTELDADYGQVDGQSVFPKELPDFYRGRVVTVYGRFDPGADKTLSMRLTGAAGERKKELVFRADIAKAGQGGKEIARNWAFEKVYHLIGETVRIGNKPELVNEMQALSKRYNIQTSYDFP